VFVPRSSSTSVAAWTWPTWVVSRRRVLEAVFVLLESPSPLRRIFIGSHLLPLSGSPYRSFSGVDERVEYHGGTGGSSVCPCGSAYHMDVLLMPLRGSVSLLGGATSSSLIRGDSETECLLEELDGRVFLVKQIGGHLPYCCCTKSQRVHGGLLAGGKNTQGKYMDGGVYYGEFCLLLLLEGGE
jgi:hypothetical protein